MKIATRVSIFTLGLAAMAGAATFVMMKPDTDKDSKPTVPWAKEKKVVAALDTLSDQLQRRFHDRNNVSFGMERMVRVGARLHSDVVAGKMGQGGFTDEDGKPMKYRAVEGKAQYEVSPGNWVAASELKRTMHAENDEERAAIDTLKNSGYPVAIYTAGMFGQEGKPLRLKGPAYLTQNTPTATPADGLAKIAEDAWKSDKETVKAGAWTYVVGRVKIDDKSCLSCHTTKNEAPKYFISAKQDKPADADNQLKVGSTVGIFLIGLRDK